MKVVRRPILRVFGPSGADLVPRWGGALLGVTVTDHAGHESDECVIKLAFVSPWTAKPPKGARYEVWAGWEDAGVMMLGVYTLQRTRRQGDPDEGESIEVICRAADMTDKAKKADSRHYDEESGHGTAGKLFEAVGEEMGLAVTVDPAIAAIKIPYRLRWQQSAIDFATELADDVGAMVKPQAGKLVVTKRGGGTSGGGEQLPPITIVYDEAYSYEAEDEPRGEYQTTGAPWFDPETGRSAEESFAGPGAGSKAGVMHPSATKDEAKLQAGATGDAHDRSSATGSFEKMGDPLALAGAPVTCIGFGEGIDDVEWKAKTVTHEFGPGGDGWVTTIETEAREKPKEGSKTS